MNSATALNRIRRLGLTGDEPLLKVPVEENVETFSTQLPADTAARRVRLSMARMKYEHTVSVADIDELEEAVSGNSDLGFDAAAPDAQAGPLYTCFVALQETHVTLGPNEFVAI